MPDGKTHESINAAVLVVLVAGLYYVSGNNSAVISSYINTYTILAFSGAYLFATFFLSPDLDIKSKPYRRWKALRIIWWPYKTLFSHRGFSHNVIIGPLSIVMNLALVTIPVLLLAGVEMQDIPISFIAAVVAGMILSMEVHIISDSVISKIKSAF